MAKRKQAKASRAKASKKTAPKTAPKKPAKRAAAKPAKAAKAARKTSASKSKGFQLGSLAPTLTQNDLAQSLAWYCDVLGFVVGKRWERDGALVGAELQAGKVAVYLSQEDGKMGERTKGQGFRLYWYTDQNIDQIANGIKSRGGTLVTEPKDEWGVRAFNLEDPTGFKITVSSNR
jgi:uncharacterized glyoxalase superfamily protein PhnB